MAKSDEYINLTEEELTKLIRDNAERVGAELIQMLGEVNKMKEDLFGLDLTTESGRLEGIRKQALGVALSGTINTLVGALQEEQNNGN